MDENKIKIGQVVSSKDLKTIVHSGMIEPANIESYNRKILNNPDGSVSTTSSMSFNEGGQEILIPTVINGKRYSLEDAISHYHQTGEHLGKFKDVNSANIYAEELHKRQARKIPYGGLTR